MGVSRNLTNNFIEQKLGSINNTYRLKFHMSPRVGWMNDPNGLVYFNGKYHLYYQAYPYRTKPGQMMWGHFVSEDLIKFEDKGIALALDALGENAYSGGALVENNLLHIYYTLHTEKHPQLIRYDGDIFEPDEVLTEEENEKRKTAPHPIEGKDIKEEDIYHYISIDGEALEKGELVFDNETLPPNISRTDFRDPCPVKIEDMYYIFVGGKDITTNKGVIIVLKSDRLNHFEYAFTIGPFYELGDMAECPSYFRVDNKDVIVVSGCNTCRKGNDFRNINCSLFVVGDLNFIEGYMKVDFIKEIDKGDSFYAAQFIREADRPIIVGWMEMWGKNYPTSKWHHGYVGAFSIPRELYIKDNDIYQRPVKELTNHLEKTQTNWNKSLKEASICLLMKKNSSITFSGDNGEIVIGNDDNGVFLDTSKSNNMFECIRRTNNRYIEAKLQILLDTSSVEVFVNDGKEVITSRFYIDGEIKLTTSGEIKDLEIRRVS